ncbi:protein PET100 homolog, mitochondrial isoform X2 [Micropterus dolomieu]|uniref:protein PET100 homolog, mitochondrial isoform X2 n=1 Tax=Micropterus dolomieu TaxID=147949 RepID=UPI001E8E63D9|nr:protein PET100 homolog, mitochondrial isoform X2 [Micropterus dolomieu]
MGVKIEMFRSLTGWSFCFEQMMLYLSFPVTMFWISNQAEYFEEYIVKRKREIFPPDEGMHRKELEDFKERMRVRKERRILKDISLESEN